MQKVFGIVCCFPDLRLLNTGNETTKDTKHTKKKREYFSLRKSAQSADKNNFFFVSSCLRVRKRVGGLLTFDF